MIKGKEKLGTGTYFTSIIYPDSKMVTYVINSINKLEKIIDWLGNEITYVWDPVGNLSEIIYPNGITAAMNYDSSNRLISVEHTDNYEATICSHQYTLDDVGNRTALSMNQPLVPTPLVTAHTYSYEFMNKLTSVDGTTTFTYDNHGNTISKVSSDITSTYSYDDADRLIQRQIDEDITQYCYNGLGHRISKQVGTQTTRYILDINSPLSWVMAETDESNQITAYYVYGSEVGLVSKITPAGQAYYYHYYGAGNTICMTDSSGTIVNKYAYDEFGILTDYVETIPNPFRYVGRYGVMDEGNGLLFMRARYYDPEIGRFLTTDPVNLATLQIMKSSPNFANSAGINNLYRYGLYTPQTLNAYVYVRNNPVNYTDPFGLFRWDTFGYGVSEILLGGGSFIGGITFSVGTSGLAAAAGGLAVYEGAGTFAVGVADIIGAFNDAPPFVSQLPPPIGDMFYILPPSIPTLDNESQNNNCI